MSQKKKIILCIRTSLKLGTQIFQKYKSVVSKIKFSYIQIYIIMKHMPSWESIIKGV